MAASLIDNNRITIGLTLGSISNYNESFCQEIATVCEEKDINLVIFPNNYQEYLESQYFATETFDHGYYMSNDYINEHNVDGLVMMFRNPPPLPTNKTYPEHFKDLYNVPVVSVNGILKDVPSITVDNEFGIKEAMVHLISFHGYKSIAFIKGPPDHPHTIARYEAYLEILDKYGLPFNPDLVVNGDFTLSSGRQAAQELLNCQKGSFQAIMSSNDEMAIGAIQVFLENGIKLPDDLKIIGFDYIKPIQYDLCPIATVRQPFREMAETAIDYVLKKIKQVDIPLLTQIPSRLVIKPSCGCHYGTINEDHTLEVEFKKITENATLDIKVMDRIHKLTSIQLESFKKVLVSELPYLLINNFFMSIFHSKDHFEFEHVANGYLNSKLILRYQNSELCEDTTSIIYDRTTILPKGLIKKDKRLTMILGPLSFEKEDYGFIFYEPQGNILGTYEHVRRQLCSSLKSIFLIEQLHKAQAELVHAEKMASLGALVAGVAHEINTPIGVSVSAASYAQDNSSILLENYRAGKLKKTDFEKYLETSIETDKIILQNLKKASDLITSFKNISVDQSSEKKRVFFVKDYIDQIILSLKPKIKKTKQQIKVICDEKIEIESYPGALSQILTNLILNSLLHAYRPEDNGIITIEIIKHMNRVKLIYSDDGVGINPKNIDHIFDPFFTTKRGSGGTGLGLNVVYNLVKEKLNGTIVCSSTEGQGTRFELEWSLNSNK